MERIVHPIDPVFDGSSRVLILGTMPSPKSRAECFYYMHPQNRFWPVLAEIYGEDIPMGKEARKAFALSHHIALWDTLKSCDIIGASDSSIRNPKPNDIASLCEKAPIRAVFTTGRSAEKFYQTYIQSTLSLPHFSLFSPSPANCAISKQQLIEQYRQIKTWAEEE